MDGLQNLTGSSVLPLRSFRNNPTRKPSFSIVTLGTMGCIDLPRSTSLGVEDNTVVVKKCEPSTVFDSDSLTSERTYKPSLELTGGHRILSYLDPSEPKHDKLKRVISYLLKSSHDSVLPEFHSSFTELFETLKTEEFWVDLNKFITKAYERTDQAILSHSSGLRH
ncbi:hypothetical protein ACFX2I_000416 [Malus domestica]